MPPPAPLHPPGRNARRWPVHGAGAVALAAWIFQGWVSRHPGPDGLLTLLATQAIGWIALGWVLLHFRQIDIPPAASLSILAWAGAFRLAAGLGAPLLDDDFARYLWDGWRLVASGNPYSRTPADFFADPGVPESLRGVLDQVNNPALPTIYGPGLQAWFGLAAMVAPGALWPWKVLAMAADAGIVALLVRRAGLRAALLYSWCPLVIRETAGNVHAEVFAVLPLLLAWDAARRQAFVRAGVLLGWALASKITVLPAVPFLLGAPWHRPRAWAAALGIVLALYAPFWIQGGPADSASLQTFLRSWEFNSSLVGLLGRWLDPFWARALPQALALMCMATWWLRWKGNLPERARLDWVFGIQLAAAAVVNPWYLLWIAPFAAMHPTCTAWTALAAVPLSYATSLNLGLNLAGPYEHPAWVRPLEYGLILGAFAVDLWRARRSDGRI